MDVTDPFGLFTSLNTIVDVSCHTFPSLLFVFLLYNVLCRGGCISVFDYSSDRAWRQAGHIGTIDGDRIGTQNAAD